MVKRIILQAILDVPREGIRSKILLKVDFQICCLRIKSANVSKTLVQGLPYFLGKCLGKIHYLSQVDLDPFVDSQPRMDEVGLFFAYGRVGTESLDRIRVWHFWLLPVGLQRL